MRADGKQRQTNTQANIDGNTNICAGISAPLWNWYYASYRLHTRMRACVFFYTNVVIGYILNIPMCLLLASSFFFSFFVACGRIGLTSRWTSLTACKQSQAWVSLTNLLILWISTQSCDNDTSWADLAGQTAGGRGGKAICSCKEHEWGAGGWGLWLLILPTKQKRKKKKYIPPSLCP